MGPGFFPRVLGMPLTALGILTTAREACFSAQAAPAGAFFAGDLRCLSLPPSHRGSDVLQNSFDHMGVVIHAQLVGDGQQQRVGLGDGLVPT